MGHPVQNIESGGNVRIKDVKVAHTHKDLYARSRYQGQGQVHASLRYRGM